MPSKCSFIVIEGLDGSGKSTVARKLADYVGGVYYRTPPGPLDQLRNIFDAPHISVRQRFLFYTLGNIVAAEKIREILTTSDVVCDRYVLSTIANHRCMDRSTSSQDGWLAGLMPDFTFFLDVSEESRRRRLEERGTLSHFDGWLENKAVRRRIKSYICGQGAILVRNDGDVEETVRTIVDHISNNQGE